MIIFYPPSDIICTPVAVADFTDSSDRWTQTEIYLAAFQNMPSHITAIAPPDVYSCKYEYTVNHNGTPLGEALKMTLQASIKVPPSDLIAQVSVGFVSSASSTAEMADALSVYANPEMKIMTAAIVEKSNSLLSAFVCRSFVAFSVVLQPDPYGSTATLFIKAASFDDALVKSALGFQLVTTLPLSAQLSKLCASLGYAFSIDPSLAAAFPVCGRMFQPSTLPKILDEICLQNKLIYKIEGQSISVYSQTSVPLAVSANPFDVTEFSFLGYAGNIMWGVGVENYANVKFRTPIFDPTLFNKITLYNDSESSLFSGLKRNPASLPASYDCYVIRYAIIRNDSELCLEVTATNNWLLAQIRVDGIFDKKIYQGVL